MEGKKARSGGDHPGVPAPQMNYRGMWTGERGSGGGHVGQPQPQGQPLTLFHWDLSFSFSNRLYSRRSLTWVRIFQTASRRMPMATTPDTVPPTMGATWGPPTHSEARKKYTCECQAHPSSPGPMGALPQVTAHC